VKESLRTLGGGVISRQASKKIRQDFTSGLPLVEADLFNFSRTSALLSASAGVIMNTTGHITIKTIKNRKIIIMFSL
jgi:hypothetical protein